MHLFTGSGCTIKAPVGVDAVPNSAGQSPYLANIVQLRTSNSHEDIAHLIFWDPEADS